MRQPSLDDVFFSLTGHGAEEVGADRAPTPSWREHPHDRRTTSAHRPCGTRARASAGLVAGWRDVVALTRRNLLHIRREPLQLSDVTIQPVLFTVLFIYVFGSAVAGAAGATRSTRSQGSWR